MQMKARVRLVGPPIGVEEPMQRRLVRGSMETLGGSSCCLWALRGNGGSGLRGRSFWMGCGGFCGG